MKPVRLADARQIGYVFDSLAGAVQATEGDDPSLFSGVLDDTVRMRRQAIRWLSHCRDFSKGLEGDLALFKELDECGVIESLPEAFIERAAVLSGELGRLYRCTKNDSDEWRDEAVSFWEKWGDDDRKDS